jgi:hypothetical protein
VRRKERTRPGESAQFRESSQQHPCPSVADALPFYAVDISFHTGCIQPLAIAGNTGAIPTGRALAFSRP